MNELDRNLNEVTELALKTGESVATVECPCCHKTFYILKSEAVFSVINRNEETDFGADLKKLSGKELGRKCPFCGFSGEIGGSDFLNLGRDDFMREEIEAEQKAEELVEKNQVSWAEICRPGLDFRDEKDD